MLQEYPKCLIKAAGWKVVFNPSEEVVAREDGFLFHTEVVKPEEVPAGEPQAEVPEAPQASEGESVKTDAPADDTAPTEPTDEASESRDALIAEAKALGIPVKGTWGNKKITDAIAAAKEESEAK